MSEPVIIGDAVLYSGDCLDVMPVLQDESIDMIFTDLPYGTTECDWDDVIDPILLWPEYERLIKPNGAIVLTAAQPFTSELVVSNKKLFRYEWIWEKGNATGFYNAKKQPLRAHESVLVFYKGMPTYNPQITHGHERRTTKRKVVDSECYGKSLNKTEYDSTSRYPRDVIFFSSDKQVSNFHPTQKPVSLGEYFIRTYTNEGMTVLDNTMGSGTFGVAAVNTKRKYIGIEKPSKKTGEKHFNTACERITSAIKQDRMFA